MVIYENSEIRNSHEHGGVQDLRDNIPLYQLRLYECVVCYKAFQSKSTLESHLTGQRHSWHMKKALEHFDNIKRSWTEAPYRQEQQNINEINRKDLLSYEGFNSSEEGYCTDSDDNKKQNGFYDDIDYVKMQNAFNNDTDGSKLQNSFHDDINDIKLPNSFHNNLGDNKMQSLDDSNEPIESDYICSSFNDENEERGRSRSQNLNKTKEKSRRKKMEELKEMYKHYAVTRGSNDLYQTMLDSYEDCSEDYENCMNALHNQEDNDLHHREIKRPQSVTEKEALMRRDLVLTELADTERDYVDDLGFVINEYIPLLQRKEVSKPLRENFEIIFGNITEIYRFHSRIFLEKIEDCLELPQLLKETFCSCEDELVTLYSQYCKCKPSADEALHIHEAEMEIIRKTYLPQRKLTIKDFLVKPVQRLMKYQLLLNTVLKYSQKATLDTTDLAEAVEVVERVPKEANDAMHVELITGYEGYLPSDDLIFQDSLDVIIGKAKVKPKNMRVFLFEKVVVFTETIKQRGRLPIYKCLAHGKTYGMGITETVENDTLKFAVWFRKYKTTDIYVCRAESAVVKENWLQVLRDIIAIQAILQNRASRYSYSSAAKSREEAFPRQTHSQHRTALIAQEAIRQAMQGHPRMGAMSDKLKHSIENYIMHELIIPEDIDENGNIRKRSKSLKLASSLVSKADMKPCCRPRRDPSNDSRSLSKDRKEKAREKLVDAVTHVSFLQLDP